MNLSVRGKIYKKRPYYDNRIHHINCIAFLELDEGMKIFEDSIKIMPILCEGRRLALSVGENVEINGVMELRQITTISGERNIHSLPVLLAESVEKIS
ncbi:MAG TPA: hypothetical protein VJ824_06845 [Bacillota bacterium]|nr:hypothetical protein [Bacillota bacterium]